MPRHRFYENRSLTHVKPRAQRCRFPIAIRRSAGIVLHSVTLNRFRCSGSGPVVTCYKVRRTIRSTRPTIDYRLPNHVIIDKTNVMRTAFLRNVSADWMTRFSRSNTTTDEQSCDISQTSLFKSETFMQTFCSLGRCASRVNSA
jgi:hypothetical protein